MHIPWMSRRERRTWHSATTLAELGELVAQWLEGDLASQPGYQPRYGPDEETRELIPALAAACRAGYVTGNSQPGHGPQLGFDGLLWSQRPAVDGLIDDPQLLRRLVDAAEKAGLIVILHDLLDPPGKGAVPATTRGEEVHTAFGTALGIRDLDLSWSGCSSQALGAIAAATQLTLLDPDFADTTRLWDVLARVAAGEPEPEEDDDPGWLEEDMITDCANCGAQYSGARLYCSDECESADEDDEDDEAEVWQPPLPAPRPAPVDGPLPF